MCRERKYVTRCCPDKLSSYDTPRWELCEEPNRPACVVGEIVVDDKVDLRERTCKNCAPKLLSAGLDHARDTTPHLSAESGNHPRNATNLPASVIARFPRELPSAVQAGHYTEGLDIPPITGSSNRLGGESVRAAYEPQFYPFFSPTPFSSQGTGVVYTEDGQRFPNTVEASWTHRVPGFEESSHTNIEVDDATRELIRKYYDKQK